VGFSFLSFFFLEKILTDFRVGQVEPGDDDDNWLPCCSKTNLKVSKDLRENVRQAFVTRGVGGEGEEGKWGGFVLIAQF
jgi:hypothetical protein